MATKRQRPARTEQSRTEASKRATLDRRAERALKISTRTLVGVAR